MVVPGGDADISYTLQAYRKLVLKNIHAQAGIVYSQSLYSLFLGFTDSSLIDMCYNLQAYRVLVLKKHPDKNRNNPNAAKEFNELQVAYDLVMDPAAREAWVQLQRRAHTSFVCSCKAQRACSPV